MAVWQFDFVIIPKGKYKKSYNENDLVFQGIEKIDVTEKYFKGILDFSKGWSDDLLVYGDNDKTCVKILREEANVLEISCRLDLRNISKFILEKIVKYINLIGGEIYYNGIIYEPKINILVELIKNSEANSYCKNPIGYLKNLSLN